MTKDSNAKALYTMTELTELILRNEEITEGHYLAVIVPDITGGQIKSNTEDKSTQGLIIEFNAINLIKVNENTENAVDASCLT
ncbi:MULTISPECIES: hypothetical protein [Psychrobacter]|jgi:hypothetical protein|uniref:hypothetical protein n=1 Tax=Psychrobacter TaxID=497 RepID=UPI0008A6DEA2|nr:MULTISPECIES: hypothetical protein [Psychrobacter]AOY43936.1 hypothetical protein AOT82_1557 [Psychrobacter sp. AntiMn-1]BBI66155.1 hypothetical protein PKHYL_03460 [Psychrobacter sp. KH172YL61]HBL97184.1 hypothetical protein [Psychrobacter sp.]|tara:strand:+ start:281 stop:529 length:249 start_codon:yes stop_codon:yes gene_type:complete